MKKFLRALIRGLESLRFLPLLGLRWALAYAFYLAAAAKFENIQETISFFETLNLPDPKATAYLVLILEGLGAFLLFFGLLTRLITIPLMIIIGVAIATVHWVNGFSVAHNGFEIPLYIFLMLFTLFILGPGALSIDALIRRKIKGPSKHPHQEPHKPH